MPRGRKRPVDNTLSGSARLSLNPTPDPFLLPAEEGEPSLSPHARDSVADADEDQQAAGSDQVRIKAPQRHQLVRQPDAKHEQDDACDRQEDERPSRADSLPERWPLLQRIGGTAGGAA